MVEQTNNLSTMQRIFRNAFWLLMQLAGGRLLSLFLAIILARYLGVEGYGNFSFIMAFVGFFAVFGNLGLGIYTVKEVSSNKKLTGIFFGNGLVLNIFLAFIVGSLMVGTSNMLYVDNNFLHAIYLMGLSYIFCQVGSFFNSFFIAHENMVYVFVMELAHKISLFVLCAACVFLKLDFIYIAGAYVIASIVYLTCTLGFTLKFFEIKISSELDDYICMLKNSFPYGLSAIALVVYFSADIMILSFFKNNEVVGIYSAAYKLFISLGIISSIYLGAVFPVLSRLFKESPAGLKKAYDKTFKFLLIIGVPLSFGGIILSKKIIVFIYDAPFLSAFVPFSILTSIVAINFFNAFFGHFLAAIGKVGDNLKYLSLACFTNIILNLILIPKFGYIGSALSTVVSELIFFIWAFNYLKKKGYFFMPGKLLGKIFVFSLIMSGILALISGLNVIVLIAMGALIYLTLIWVTKTVDTDDLKLLKEAIGFK